MSKGQKATPLQLTPEEELALIREKLKHPTREEIKYWLDTGDNRLNSVIGSEAHGFPYGKQLEIAGWESHGKTSLLYELIAAGQKDGAKAAIWDLEDSSDEAWMTARGVDYSKVVLFKPMVGKFGGEQKKRMITAEEQCEEIEMWMDMNYARNKEGRMIIGVDSVAAIMTEEEEAHGITEQNMRTKVSIASFLTFLLKRWQKRASNYNALIIWVNQLRHAPGKWGNPEYTPGGNAMRFYCASRIKVRRVSGKILKAGEQVGFKGIIQNWKNKAGEGSKEGLVTGFKQYYDGRLKYVDVEDVKQKKE